MAIWDTSNRDSRGPASAAVKLFMDLCYEASETSTCNKRQVGAILVLENGRYYDGSNGNKRHSCKAAGPNHCTRDERTFGLEFLTCPSVCAEGEVMLQALFAGEEQGGGRLFTTGFPCERCKDLVIHFGISQVYFSNYKNGQPRLYEALYAAQMVTRGVSLYQYTEMDGHPVVERTTFNPDMLSFARMSAITPGDSWLGLMLDPRYRHEVASLAHARRDVYKSQRSA